MDGSVQRGNTGMLRVDIRIRYAATTEYLWARRYQYSVEQLKIGETTIGRQISRELHLLLLQNQIRRVALSVGGGDERNECLSNAALALDGALQVELTAEAQHGLAIADGFAGYNAALLGRAHETLPAIDRAMGLDPAARRHSIWFFFAGFAELLVGRIDCSIVLLKKSLERNPSYGSALLFLIAAYSLSGRNSEAAQAAAFRQHYPDCPPVAFEQLWSSRSASASYRAQISPLLERIRDFGVAT